MLPIHRRNSQNRLPLLLPLDLVRLCGSEKASPLEIPLPSELHLPRAIGRVTDNPEVGIVNGGVRCTENWMIERILRLQSQLELHSFANSRQRKLLLH